MKAIVYSLFGYDRETPENCFDFETYVRGLMINARLQRLLYPGWKIVLQTDKATYNGIKDFLDRTPFIICINEPAALTKAMLWRLKPAFYQIEGERPTHILCRDLDSPITYREAQAVEFWVKSDKAFHAITDSISHNIPLLGGMIGVRPQYFTDRVGNSWDDMLGGQWNWERKGEDQRFLNERIYPLFAFHGTSSIVQHYFNGHPKTFLPDYYTCQCEPEAGHSVGCPNDFKLNLPEDMKQTNGICGHIGAAGWYETATFKFLRKYYDKFEDLRKAEAVINHYFNWKI